MTGTTRLQHGDCRKVLAGMPDASIDAVVTDPPYELGFMGKRWDAAGVAYDAAMWAEVLRVLKPGGYLLAFGGTRTYHRMAVAIEDAGFEIRDSIHWIYGSGFPKSHNLKDDWNGWGTALKPAHEPIVVARKPLVRTVAANVLEHGTGALNIDGCRVASDDGYEKQWDRPVSTNISQAPQNYISNGSQGVVDLSAYKPNGRWPANVVLTHHADCRPAGTAEETVGGGEAGTSDFAAGYESCDGFVGRTVGATVWNCHPECPAAVMDGQSGDSGGPSRYFTQTEWDDELDGWSFLYEAKANKRERNAGTPDGNKHPTVKPVALMRWLIRLVTPPGGTVLDPFTGSGTTGVAATLEGFTFVGIEQDDDYIDLAEARISHSQLQTNAISRQAELFDTDWSVT